MKNKIEYAAKTIKEGGIIAYPTEGVYGLGCDPFNETAVLRLLKIKKRSVSKGLILIASSWDQVKGLTKISDKDRSLINGNKNQPITWIFPASSKAPGWITGKFKTIAIRVTLHPVAESICQKFGGPIVSTSANLSSQPTITNFRKIKKSVLVGVDFVVQGKVGTLKKPTKICDIKTRKLVRN